MRHIVIEKAVTTLKASLLALAATTLLAGTASARDGYKPRQGVYKNHKVMKRQAVKSRAVRRRAPVRVKKHVRPKRAIRGWRHGARHGSRYGNRHYRGRNRHRFARWGWVAPLLLDRGYRRSYNRCVSGQRVKRRLRRRGWSDFHNFKVRPHIVKFNAYRPSGRLVRLTLDRCSGAIIRRRPLYEDYSYRSNRYK